jgi:hypothetical protein
MLIFGAALGSLVARLVKPRYASSQRQGRPATPSPRVVFALVQTKPHVVVLAVSRSEEELIKEMNELNSTWNHWNLRAQDCCYQVQPVPVLVEVPPTAPAMRTVAASRSR